VWLDNSTNVGFFYALIFKTFVVKAILHNLAVIDNKSSMKNLISHWPTALLIATCGLVGYAIGETQSHTFESEVLKKDAHSTARRPFRNQMAETSSLALFEILLTKRNASKAETWKVVSRLILSEISQALQLVKIAQAKESSGPSFRDLSLALYFRWAEIAPLAALAGVASETDSYERKLMFQSVLTAWIRTDPIAAYNSVKSHQEFGRIGRDMLVRTWTHADVFEKLRLFPQEQQVLLQSYCESLAEKEIGRNAMLAAFKEQPEMEGRDEAQLVLFQEWSYKDFGSAIAKAQEMNLPGTVATILEGNLTRNPDDAIQWASQHKIPPSPLWHKGYNEWLGYDGPGARKWLHGAAAEMESTGNVSAVASFFAQDFENAQAMKFITEQDAAEEKLIGLVARWKTNDSEAAAKWLSGSSEAVRKVVSERENASHD
jgi:hypothetical protein